MARFFRGELTHRIIVGKYFSRESCQLEYKGRSNNSGIMNRQMKDIVGCCRGNSKWQSGRECGILAFQLLS